MEVLAVVDWVLADFANDADILGMSGCDNGVSNRKAHKVIGTKVTKVFY